MFKAGDIISYVDMCQLEGTALQHGMNFRLRGGHSVLLMSLRPNAPYADQIKDEGRTLIYEGHDVPNRKRGPDPKSVDQPIVNPGGTPTRNGLFFEAAKRAAKGEKPERVRVYEKIKAGIWSFTGLFELVDAVWEKHGSRKVFKFQLSIIDSESSEVGIAPENVIPHDRIIPPHVKFKVWKRDGGKCVKCGDTKNLHFDHILPFSKGGTSLTEANIQLLCVKHNLAKSAKIED